MSWKDKMKEFGGGDLAFLSTDGECLMFVVVGEPVLIKGKYKGQATEKIGCPIVTEDGFQLLLAGKRLARKIAKREDGHDKDAYIAIRHGVEEDPLTTYELKVVDDKKVIKRLYDLKVGAFSPEIIAEAIKAAEEVMKA